MLFKKTSTLSLLLSLFINWGPIRAEVITDQRGSMELSIPAQWKYAKNVMGMPHLWVSPIINDRRHTLGLTFTGKANVNWDKAVIEKEQSNYQNGRKSYAKKMGATIEKFLPPIYLKTSDGHDIHGVGYIFNKNGQKHTEVSYYILCPKSLNHLKTFAIGDETNQKKVFDATIKSLKCF